MRAAAFLAVELLAVMATRPAAASRLEVVLRSGVSRGAGAVLDTIGPARGRTATDIAFVGTSSALVASAASGLTVVVAGGDGMPAPFTGTFTAVWAPTVSDDGRVVFAGSGTGGTSGIFAWDGTALTTLDATAAGAPSVNAVGDIAFGTARTISLWDHSTGTSRAIVRANDPIFGSRRVRFGAVRLADTNLVAFVVLRRSGIRAGVFGRTASSGVFPIAREGDPGPLAGTIWYPLRGQAVAVNAAGSVAFTAATGVTGVFVRDPVGGTTTQVAHVGDLVDGIAVERVNRAWVGIDDAGAVAFEGKLADLTTRLALVTTGGLTALTGPLDPAPTDVSPRLTNSHRVVWSADRDVQAFDGASVGTALSADAFPLPGFDLSSPDVSEGGLVVAEARRSALFRLGPGGARLLYFGGGALAGVGPLYAPDLDVSAHAYVGDALVLAAGFPRADGSDGTVLAVDTDKGPRPIAVSGEPSPLGGTLAPYLDLEDVGFLGRKVVFVAASVDESAGTTVEGLFARDLDSGALEGLLRADQPGTGVDPFAGLHLVGASAGVVVISVALFDGRVGLFEVRRHRVRSIAVEAEPVAGGTLGTIEESVMEGERLFFRAPFVDTAGGAVEGLFVWKPGKPVEFVTRLDVPVDGDGVQEITAIVPRPRRSPLLAGRSLPGASGGDVVLGVRRHGLRVLLEERLWVRNGTILGPFIGALAVWGKTIGFEGSAVDGTGASRAGVFVLAGNTVIPLALEGGKTTTGDTVRVAGILLQATEPVLAAALDDGSSIIAVPRRRK